MFSASKSGAASTGYNLTNSLRFRRSATASLTRTASFSGTTNTISFWFKRGELGTRQALFGYTNYSNNALYLQFINDNLDFANLTSGSYNATLSTTQVFRDPSAWYHIVFVVDTTNATSSNRLRLYINGVQVTAVTATYPAQNTSLQLANSLLWSIGREGTNNSQCSDGYIAEFNFIDGQALTPSSFGSTNATTGVWQPARYTGSYGTNGFYLKFSDIATTSGSNAGLGKDFSGNGNYWNTNNISVTAGTTYDAMTDVPTNTSATVANYAVLNPVNTGATVSNGNLLSSTTSTAPSPSYSTIGMTSGKYYFECKLNSTNIYVGVWGNGNLSMPTGAFPTYYWDIGASAAGALALEKSSGTASGTLGNLASGDLYGIALDIDNTTIYFYKNNSLVQTVTGMIFTGPLFFALGPWTSSTSSSNFVNFGQQPFVYTPPTGYVALNTFNLPTPTILQGNKYMDANLWTGTSSNQNIVNAGQFKPDFAWIKIRNTTGFHVLVDSVRVGTGGLSILASNSTDAEATTNLSSYVTGFNSNGVALGNQAATSYFTNTSGNTFVGWQWQAGQGSTSSNTSGSITSTVSVNTTAGFSVVTYTGTGANATVGHGLGVAPKMLIVKNRSIASAWRVWFTGFAGTEQLNLNETGGKETGQITWNSTVPSSTVFSLGTPAAVNGNGNSLVAYLWSEIAGFSKFGSYTANASTDGPFIYTGFRPKYILIKGSVAGNNWVTLDTSRSTYNQVAAYLLPNVSNAEGTAGDYIDILSNGFKIRDSGSDVNYSSGATYIYMAFAENPFKNALAR